MQTPADKLCARCKRLLPASAFRPNLQLRSGLHSWCRECHLRRTRRWRAENRDYVDAANAARRLQPQIKTCAVCGAEFLAKRKDAKACSSACRSRRGRSSGRGARHSSIWQRS